MCASGQMLIPAPVAPPSRKSFDNGQLVRSLNHLLDNSQVNMLDHDPSSISAVMISRLMLNLHEAAARTAHASHAMRVVGNARSGVSEQLDLDVLSGDSEPLSTDSGRSGGTSRSLRRSCDEHAARCA
jgi:hypothetical protein